MRKLKGNEHAGRLAREAAEQLHVLGATAAEEAARSYRVAVAMGAFLARLPNARETPFLEVEEPAPDTEEEPHSGGEGSPRPLADGGPRAAEERPPERAAGTTLAAAMAGAQATHSCRCDKKALAIGAHGVQVAGRGARRRRSRS